MEIRNGENEPCQRNEQYHVDVTCGLVLIEELACPEFFAHDYGEEDKSPYDEVPACAVPYACEQPYNKAVEYQSARALAVSAEGDVDVFPEPRTQSDVPSSPEFGHCEGSVRMVEVSRQVEAHELAKTYSHQRVAAEIEIKLEGVGENTHPCQRRGNTLVADHGNIAPEATYLIGDEDLVAETDSKGFETFLDFADVMGPFLKLLCHCAVSYDRACDKLGEHTDVCAVVDKTSFRRRFPSVNIDDVGNVLEGVEAYSYRQDNVLQRQVRTEEDVDVFGAECPVLEEDEPPEIECHAEDEPRFFEFRGVLDELTDYEIQHIRQQEEDNINGLFDAQTVENHTAQKNDKIFIF